MECDCKPDSACTSTAACGDEATDLWINLNSVLTGVLAVVGYILFRFSQALPAIIRWPIRLFCSLTGLSSLWSWVSRLLSTVRGLQTVMKWLGPVWRFIVALPTKLSWVPSLVRAVAGSLTNVKKCLETVINLIQRLRAYSKEKSLTAGHSSDVTTLTDPALLAPSGPFDPGLRLVLIGPQGAGRGWLGDALLGHEGSPGALGECVSRRAIVKGREVTVVDTPDLLGSSMGPAARAREALRSIQLASPGPHAFLLVMRAPGSGDAGVDEAGAFRALLALMGEGALSYVLPVLTHADSLGQLPRGAPGDPGATLPLCGQRVELVDSGAPGWPSAERRALGTRLLERVEEMKTLGAHYVHELQRKEDRIRETLLEDMAAALERRLEVREKDE